MSVEQDSFRTYAAEARTWSVDRSDRLLASRRIAVVVAWAACLVALIEGAALVLMLPLRQVVPYMVLVDRQTGFVQALDPNSNARVSADTALRQSLLAQYVVAREGFDRDGLPAAYRKVGLWSAGPARNDYVSSLRRENPASPLVRLPGGSWIEARVKSVSLMSAGTAMVRFDTIVHDQQGAAAAAQPWLSIVRFSFSNARMSIADRFDNPLGFQVVSYHRDAEASTADAPPTRAAPVTSARAADRLAFDAVDQPRVVTTVGSATATRPAGYRTELREDAPDARHLPAGSPFDPGKTQ